MLYLYLLIYDFFISDILLLSYKDFSGGNEMVKLKAASYSIYDRIYEKVQALARRTLDVIGTQPELVRVPETVMEKSEE